MADNAHIKQRGRPFSKGQSGNPKGKPRGTRSKSTVFGESIMQKDADEIVKAVVASAKAGDPTAMRLCVERLIPIRKGRPVVFNLPKIDGADGVDKALGSIAEAMARGELTPDEAGSVASVLELKRRAIETTVLEARLDALEKRFADGPA